MPDAGLAASAADTSWSGYYRNTADRPPRRTTLTALAALRRLCAPVSAIAVDLGCGAGRDTAPLLDTGLAVLALDTAPAAEAALRARFPEAWSKRQLTFRQVDFSVGDPNLPAACLINASFCLPACPPESFARLWSHIAQAVAPHGLFAGHFYGPNDSWAQRGDNLTVHSRREIDDLFANWEPILLEEEESDSVTPRGNAKHWHFFHIVARKQP